MATKWEYKTVGISHGDLESTLNNLGDDGWELTGQVLNASNRYIYIFKRPVPSEIDQKPVEISGLNVQEFRQLLSQLQLFDPK